MTYQAAHVSEVTEVWQPDDEQEPRWKAVRHHFGIGAFGVNAWVGQREGGAVIEGHDEIGGHEELYVVLSGHARFVVDGDEVDAPAGTFLFVTPESKREATAVEAGTTVLAIGATRGVAFEPSTWELRHTEKQPA